MANLRLLPCTFSSPDDLLPVCKILPCCSVVLVLLPLTGPALSCFVEVHVSWDFISGCKCVISVCSKMEWLNGRNFVSRYVAEENLIVSDVCHLKGKLLLCGLCSLNDELNICGLWVE